MSEEFSKKYYDLLNNEFKGINLTRITNYDEFCHKQIEDSVAPIGASKVFRETLDKVNLLVDVGFGGGFPILPLANTLNKCRFVGIETRGKKVRVVSEIAQKLGLKNVKLKHERIENVLIDTDCVVTFKAVGKVFDFLSRIKTTKTIRVFFYKGPGFYELEKEQLEMCKKNWKIIEEIEMSVEGTDKRLLIGFENINTTRKLEDKSFNNLVKLSELI